MLRQTLILSCLFSLTACTAIYKQPISQGNLISATDINKVQRGMSAQQVVSLLGYPVMTNMYPENRLVYAYSLKKAYQPLASKRLIITFVNQKVSRVQQS